jgi:hypothetical protein
VTANAHKLVNGSKATNDGVIINGDVAGKGGAIGKYAIIAHYTIMGYVHIGHEEVMAAYLSFAKGFGSFIDGNALSDGGVIANGGKGILTTVFKVLGYGADYSTGKNFTVFTYASSFHDGDIASYPGAFTYFNIAVDHGEGVNVHIGSYFGIGVNVGESADHTFIIYY